MQKLDGSWKIILGEHKQVTTPIAAAIPDVVLLMEQINITMQLSIWQMLFSPLSQLERASRSNLFLPKQVSDRYTFPGFRVLVSLLLSFIIKYSRTLTVFHSPQNMTLFLYTKHFILT